MWVTFPMPPDMRVSKKQSLEMESSMPGLCRASRYNHAFPYKGEMLLFNGLSSALTVLSCPVFEQIESYLFAEQPFDPESIGDPGLRTTLEGLRSGRFFLDADTDELAGDAERRQRRVLRERHLGRQNGRLTLCDKAVPYG